MLPEEVRSRRFANQFLDKPAHKTPAELVADLGAVQAQDFGGALWALGLRLGSKSEAEVEKAFTEGSILRTHVLRPTWHFVAPGDIRWILKLTAPRIKAMMVYVNRRVGLGAADFKRSHSMLRKLLKGDKELTRNQIAEIYKQAGLRQGTEESLRMAHFMMQAELDALITSGPRRGKQFTYMLMDERAPHTKTLTREESIVELTRRYFDTRSPATARDYAWWSGLAMGDARAGIGALKGELQREMIDGKEYWLAESRPAAKSIGKRAYLLPNYDEYGIGFVDRSAMYDINAAKELEVRNRPVFSNIVVINGRAEGTWKRELKKNAVQLTLSMFRPLTKIEKSLVGEAAERYGNFLELKPIVSSAK